MAGRPARLTVRDHDGIGAPAVAAGSHVYARFVLDQSSDGITVTDLDTRLCRGFDERQVEPAALDHGDRGSRNGEMDRRLMGPAQFDMVDAPLDGLERRVRNEPLGFGCEAPAAELGPWQRLRLEEDDLGATRGQEPGGGAPGRPGSNDGHARSSHTAPLVVRSTTKFQATIATAAAARP